MTMLRSPGSQTPQLSHAHLPSDPQAPSTTSCLRAFVVISLLLVATGCAVNQANEVAMYRSVIDAEQPIPPFATADPLSLERAFDLANFHNENLGLQGEAYLRALIKKNRAVGNFLPTISLSPVYTFRDNRAGPGDSFSSSNAQFTNALSARQNLFNGFRDINNYQAAGLSADQRRFLLLDAQATVLIDVAQTYYQVLLSERNVEVLRNSLKVQEARVDEARKRVAFRVAIPLDVAQSEAQAANTRGLLITAQNNAATGRSALAFLTGAHVQNSPLADNIRIPEDLPSLDDLQQIAEKNRQDVLAALAAVQAARHGVESAIGLYYPSVNLNLNYLLTKPEMSSPGWWNGVLSANIPIFTAGQIRADVRDAWSFLRTAKLSESLTRRQVIEQVQIAYQDILSSRERLTVLATQVAAAAEALRLAEGLYAAGSGKNIDRLVAQDQLLSAQLQLTTQQVNHKLFHLQLLRAIGRLSTRLPGEPQTAPTTQPTTAPTTTTTNPAPQ